MTATAPARRIEYIDLDDIVHAVRNPKKHEIARLRQSMARYGCTLAGILDERTERLVAGHGRLAALHAMRQDAVEPPEGVVDDDGRWLVPIVRGWASTSDEEAEGYLVLDNRLAEKGGWEDKLLAEILDDLAGYDADLLDTVGYTQLDLDTLLRESGTYADRTGDYFTLPVTDNGEGDEDDEDDDEDASLTEAASGEDRAEQGLEYVQVSWIVNADQRKTIRNALARAQRLFELDTSAMALCAVAERFLDTHPEKEAA